MYCNKCRITFTFTTAQERDAWLKRHPRDHKVDNASGYDTGPLAAAG